MCCPAYGMLLCVRCGLLSQVACSWQRRACATLLLASLTAPHHGLRMQVRYKLHCLLTTVNVATCAAAVAYLVSAGSMMPSPGVLLMSATMAVCLPVLLVYNWERDHRRQFLARLGERAVPPAVAAARAKAKAA